MKWSDAGNVFRCAVLVAVERVLRSELQNRGVRKTDVGFQNSPAGTGSRAEYVSEIRDALIGYGVKMSEFPQSVQNALQQKS